MGNPSKVIAIVPARCGSKSIPLKNIKLFLGKPLIFWVLNALNKVERIDRIVLSTDCDKIESVGKSFGFEKLSVHRRSDKNAQDTSSTESVLLEIIEDLDDLFNQEDLLILAQATSPLTTENDFNSALDLLEKGSYDSILSCCSIKRFFWSETGTPINYDYKNRPRRQDFKGALVENGAIYINSIGNIRKFKNRLSGRIGVCIMSDHTFIELDEPEDWSILERLGSKFLLSKPDIFSNIKLFVSDVDGVLTDAGMYYSEKGDELKKFNTHDGMAFKLIKEKGIKTALVTSEKTEIVNARASKLKIDFLYQYKIGKGKLDAIKEICKKLDIALEEVLYVGDDINCLDAINNVGIAFCPEDSTPHILNSRAIQIPLKGGQGVIRYIYETYFN